MEVAKQQGEAMEEYAIDMGKIMEVARRLMKGGIVPATDEKKLMEYSMELYQAAKNIGAMAKEKEKEEYDSLWEEKVDKEVAEDPMEVADNAEIFAEGPEIVPVSDVMP
jgi:tRNA G46 methylase TrmB